MTTNPGLTVVVLTYNSQATIGPCLQSLVQQHHSDFDVIVVDDDSADDTLEIVSRYSSALRLSVVRNGSHRISRGRNIGICQSRSQLVAFLDSDDCAHRDWTQIITATFAQHPDLALISGHLVPAYRTSVAHAIALNDGLVRRLFAGPTSFWAGNCAINRAVLVDAYFDEDFRFAEDLELESRVRRRYSCQQVSEMKIYHYSRESFLEYAAQMYRYGFMKQHFAFTSRSYRWVDFVPLALMLSSIGAAIAFRAWWPLLLILPFSLLESIFVIAHERCPILIAALTFPAWLVKNIFWSSGVLWGLISLAVDHRTRQLLRSKRTV